MCVLSTVYLRMAAAQQPSSMLYAVRRVTVLKQLMMQIIFVLAAYRVLYRLALVRRFSGSYTTECLLGLH